MVRKRTAEQLERKRERDRGYYKNKSDAEREVLIKRSWLNRMWRNYKMTEDDYNKLLAHQEGLCAGCGAMEDHRRFTVDHDHSCCPTEKTCGECVRGLLCNQCNRILGMVCDSTTYLVGLIEYLNRS